MSGRPSVELPADDVDVQDHAVARLQRGRGALDRRRGRDGARAVAARREQVRDDHHSRRDGGHGAEPAAAPAAEVGRHGALELEAVAVEAGREHQRSSFAAERRRSARETRSRAAAGRMRSERATSS